jgi:hypothetical protein
VGGGTEAVCEGFMPALGGPLTILPLREGTFGGLEAMVTLT